MKSEEAKKLWYHTIIFIFLIFLIALVFGFHRRRRPVEPIISIIGSMTMSVVFIVYSRFMLRWFRQMEAENKPGDWEYLIGRWTLVLVFGIIFLILVIGGIIVGLYKWINN